MTKKHLQIAYYDTNAPKRPNATQSRQGHHSRIPLIPIIHPLSVTII